MWASVYVLFLPPPNDMSFRKVWEQADSGPCGRLPPLPYMASPMDGVSETAESDAGGSSVAITSLTADESWGLTKQEPAGLTEEGLPICAVKAASTAEMFKEVMILEKFDLLCEQINAQ